MDEKTLKIKAECTTLAARFFEQTLPDLFENIDDTLYERANRAGSNQAQTTLFDAMRDVRKNRKRIDALFKRQFAESFERFWKGSIIKKKATSESGGLSLVEADDLEESLAISSVISKVENRCLDVLNELAQRFSHIAKVEIDTENNPLGPTMVCQIFEEVTQSLDVDMQIRLTIYKLFEQFVMLPANDLYEDTNELLSAQGILPDLKPQKPRIKRSGTRKYGAKAKKEAAEEAAKAEAEKKGPAKEVAQKFQGMAGDESKIQIDPEIFNTLQQLLQIKRPGTPTKTDKRGVPLPAYAINDVLQALTDAQKVASTYKAGKDHNAAEFKTDLNDKLSELKGKDGNLGSSENDAIDVVGMIFAFILEDRNLPDNIKALLSRLQIPMLKVAIVDKHFFAQKHHPARRLLNTMAHAGLGWTEQSERAGMGLFSKMEEVVNHIIKHFADDPELFNHLLEDFQQFLAKDQKGSEAIEKRTNQVNKGKEQLIIAKRSASMAILERVRGQEVPDVVQKLLEEGWKDVLLLIHLRKGKDSESWEKSMKVVEQLIWSTGEKLDRGAKQELLNILPKLLRRLRDGLTSISYDAHKLAQRFRDLQTCHIARLRGAPLPVLADFTEVATSPEKNIEPKQIKQKKDEFDRKAEKLPIGTWLEFTDENSRRTRAKLSWKSSVDNNYVFVNRKGAKVAEKTVHGVAMELRRGTAVPLENVPLMDRALNAMLKTLKRNPGQEAELA